MHDTDLLDSLFCWFRKSWRQAVRLARLPVEERFGRNARSRMPAGADEEPVQLGIDEVALCSAPEAKSLIGALSQRAWHHVMPRVSTPGCDLEAPGVVLPAELVPGQFRVGQAGVDDGDSRSAVLFREIHL